MVENYDFSRFKNELEKLVNEKLANGESTKAAMINTMITNFESKINHRGVIDSHVVWKNLATEISQQIEASENIILNINDNGSFSITYEGKQTDLKDESGKQKRAQITEYGKNKENGNISITRKEVHFKDGNGELSEKYAYTSGIKAYADLSYEKAMYTPEGLGIEVSKATTKGYYNESASKLTVGEMTRMVSSNEPKYAYMSGYSAKGQFDQYSEIVHSTRGWGLGDSDNVGIFKLEKQEGVKGNTSEKTTTSIEPIEFTRYGQYLPSFETGCGIQISPGNFEDAKKEALTKFGDPKTGWESLISSAEYRHIPQELYDYATRKVHTFSKSDIAKIAVQQRAGNIKTTSIIDDRAQETTDQIQE